MYIALIPLLNLEHLFISKRVTSAHSIVPIYSSTITIDIKKLLDPATADSDSRCPSTIKINVNAQRPAAQEEHISTYL